MTETLTPQHALAASDLLHKTLMDFALWLSPVWDESNGDDLESASRAASAFLDGAARTKEEA